MLTVSLFFPPVATVGLIRTLPCHPQALNCLTHLFSLELTGCQFQSSSGEGSLVFCSCVVLFFFLTFLKLKYHTRTKYCIIVKSTAQWITTEETYPWNHVQGQDADIASPPEVLLAPPSP